MSSTCGHMGRLLSLDLWRELSDSEIHSTHESPHRKLRTNKASAYVSGGFCLASEATLLEQGDVAAPKGANQMEHLCRNRGVKSIGASLATHRSCKPYASIPTSPVRPTSCHERRESRHRTPGLFLGHAHGSQSKPLNMSWRAGTPPHRMQRLPQSADAVQKQK